MPWTGLLIDVGVVVLAIAGLLLVIRSSRRRWRTTEFSFAQQVDATDPAALAALSLDALDDLSKMKVVEVDNAVRTSDNGLALAVEEFGADRTAAFTGAIYNAKAALVQAFAVRHQLDDAIPETAAQRRYLLTSSCPPRRPTVSWTHRPKRSANCAIWSSMRPPCWTS